MDTAVLLQIASALGLATVFGAIVNGIINRKKLGAEATHLLTQAAGGIVERLEIENKRQSDRIEALSMRLEEKELREDDLERRLYLEEMRSASLLAWGKRLSVRLSQSGISDIEAPPE